MEKDVKVKVEDCLLANMSENKNFMLFWDEKLKFLVA